VQPEIKHIRALVAIESYGSFRQAAESLNISAPGLTKMIQALESQLGVELIDRKARPIGLTKYGEAVCHEGAEALARIDRGLQQVEIMKGLEQVELVISTIALLSVSIAAEAVSQLIPQYPKAHFTISSESPRDAATNFYEHRSDFFIGTEGELSLNNNAHSITLPWPDIAYIVGDGHPLLSLPEIRLADCLAYPLLGALPPTWWQEYFRDWALGIGVPLPTGYENTSPYHRAQSTDWATILMLCRTCDGITGGCRSQMQSYEHEGFKIIEPVDAPPLPDSNMILAWHENTPITTLFKDVILENQKALPGD